MKTRMFDSDGWRFVQNGNFCWVIFRYGVRYQFAYFKLWIVEFGSVLLDLLYLEAALLILPKEHKEIQREAAMGTRPQKTASVMVTLQFPLALSLAPANGVLIEIVFVDLVQQNCSFICLISY